MAINTLENIFLITLETQYVPNDACVQKRYFGAFEEPLKNKGEQKMCSFFSKHDRNYLCVVNWF